MPQFTVQKGPWILLLFLVGGRCMAQAQDGSTNQPPQVSIVWPEPGFSFTTETIKIKASATDRDGSITQVQFFATIIPFEGDAQTNLIAVVTNSPYNILWNYDFCGNRTILKAVAEDNSGARTESAPVLIYQRCGPPPAGVLQIVSPRDGDMFAAPATFAFSAEILAGLGVAAVDFFVGTNLVAEVISNMTATGPPVSITVSNLAAGDYKLSVQDRYAHCYYCTSSNVRVVNLGLQKPALTSGGRMRFDVVTSFPGRETIIQNSSNLLEWFPLSTNHPSSNTFTFTEPFPATNAQRFYRIFLPPE